MPAPRAAVVAALLWLTLPAPGAPGAEPAADNAPADRAWQELRALDAGPRERPRDRAGALAAAREHLARQEAALRRFVELYPADPRRFEARVRLSDVLAAAARFAGPAAAASPGTVAQRADAARQLDAVEADPDAPAAAKTEAAYARLRQFMQDRAGEPATGLAGDARRDSLARAIRGFDTAHPGDRRTPALLLELASLYDARPAEKKTLLDEVLTRAPETDAATRGRAGDDLRRLALLGQPLKLRLPPAAHGANPAAPVDLGARRGRVVVLLFWASWSVPSLLELERLQAVAPRFDARQVEFLTVSLDEDRAALAAAVRAERLTWPVFCDARGWEGPAVRALGLNAVPTVWIVGRDGTLRTLNARGPGAAEAAIAEALR